MSGNKEMKELNLEELEMISGGKIIAGHDNGSTGKKPLKTVLKEEYGINSYEECLSQLKKHYSIDDERFERLKKEYYRG